MDDKTLVGKILAMASSDRFAKVFHRQRFVLYGINYFECVDSYVSGC